MWIALLFPLCLAHACSPHPARLCQGVRETQAVMEETLGVSADFLATSVFCGQHQMNGLLEATDVRFKVRGLSSPTQDTCRVASPMGPLRILPSVCPSLTLSPLTLYAVG